MIQALLIIAFLLRLQFLYYTGIEFIVPARDYLFTINPDKHAEHF